MRRTRCCAEIRYNYILKDTLFDHLIGAAKHGKRNRDAQCLGCPQIDNQLDLGGLLNRQIGGLVALEDASSIVANEPVVFGFTAAIAHEATGGDEPAQFVAG